MMHISGGIGGAGGKGERHGGAGGKGGEPDLRFLDLTKHRDSLVSDTPDSKPRFLIQAAGGRGGAGGAGGLMGGAGGVGEGVSLPDLPLEHLNRVFGHIEEGIGGVGGASPIQPGKDGEGQATQYTIPILSIPENALNLD